MSICANLFKKAELSCTACGTQDMPCKHQKMALMRQRLEHALYTNLFILLKRILQE